MGTVAGGPVCFDAPDLVALSRIDGDEPPRVAEIERLNDVTMNNAAAIVVAFESTVALTRLSETLNASQ